MSVLCI